jgi:capsular exopolysaccharide synthesis family protein
MSRIQSILDKAERDGALVRMRSVNDETAYEPLDEGPPLFGGQGPATHLSPSTLVPGRVVRDVRLDPLLVTAVSPEAQTSEQYRALRTRVSHGDHAAPVHVILVTSPGRREGKTLTAANLGLSMAQDAQRQICIVDADFRHARLHKLFGLSDGPGLADVVGGRSTLSDALTLIEDQQITVLPAGRVPPHPAELLSSALMRQTIETLRDHFDCVIVDAPAAALFADIGILAPLADRIVLVVRAGVTPKPAIHEAAGCLGDANLLGILLNDTVS